ncbi:hypothetical protein G6F32_000419 [Rhizopus arrhizus]|nr:hypothetical protein G6F32_000419 [Rhizopus arrhizus]
MVMTGRRDALKKMKQGRMDSCLRGSHTVLLNGIHILLLIPVQLRLMPFGSLWGATADAAKSGLFCHLGHLKPPC